MFNNLFSNLIFPLNDARYVMLGCATFSLIGCDDISTAEDNIDIAVLENVFRQHDDQDRKLIQRNLRYGAHYNGSIDGQWGPATQAALMEAYNELSEIAGDEIRTSAQASKYLNYLMQNETKNILAINAGTDVNEWELVKEFDLKVTRRDDNCSAPVARYSRNGETAELSAYINRQVAGWTVRWDSWPGDNYGLFYNVKFDDDDLYGNGQVYSDGDWGVLTTMNSNNEIVLSMMRNASQTTIEFNRGVAPFIFKSDRFFEVSEALKQCYGEWRAEVEERNREFRRKFED